MVPVHNCMLEIRKQNVKGRVISIQQWSKDHQTNPDRCREKDKKKKVFSSINQSGLFPHSHVLPAPPVLTHAATCMWPSRETRWEGFV